jgi:hypothetical protein
MGLHSSGHGGDRPRRRRTIESSRPGLDTRRPRRVGYRLSRRSSHAGRAARRPRFPPACKSSETAADVAGARIELAVVRPFAANPDSHRVRCAWFRRSAGCRRRHRLQGRRFDPHRDRRLQVRGSSGVGCRPGRFTAPFLERRGPAAVGAAAQDASRVSRGPRRRDAAAPLAIRLN